MPGFEEEQKDSAEQTHPNAARYDELKQSLKSELDNFGFPQPAGDIHVFSHADARNKLAKLLGQIHAESWNVDAEAYDYRLADSVIDIVKPDSRDKKENN